MNRCLHITINENGDGLPRQTTQQTSQQTTAFFPSRTGTDPGGDNTMPKPDDPTDPGGDNTMPKPDDPSDPPYPSGGMSGGMSCGATVQACCCGSHCGCGAPAGTAPGSSTGASTPHPFIAPRDFSGFVIVRTAQGIDPNAASLWELANRKGRQLLGLQAVLELPFKTEEAAKKVKTSAKKPVHLTSRPLVELEGQIGGAYGARGPLPRGECIQRIQALERETALTAFRPLHSLTAYWRLDLREHPDRVEEVVAGLNRLAEVDLAYRELSGNDPQDVPQDAPGGQLFAEDQGYLGDAPMGISASWVWERLAETAPQAFLKLQTSSAHPLTVCDLEQGWNRGHQELKDLTDENGRQLPILYGANRNDEGTPGHHGTAVLGQLAAAGTSPEGIKGAATDISQFVLASHYKSKDEKEAGNKPHPFAGTNGHVAAAIVQAVEKTSGALKEGDVLLLEVQRGLLPAETDEADFDAIRLASGLGVIVVEAAGNGGFNLDAYSDAETGRSFQRGTSHFRDSGAILVGAARASLPHDRAPFSNYGSRLDCFAWGETVTTCGFGDLAGTVDADLYTNSFNGTSSASPIIAGAAALVQALHKAQTGTLLQPQSMRTLLADPATGTRQGPNVPGFIGVMPDLRAIVRGRLQLVPDVYMRRHVDDDGSAPDPTEEISSSPDILVWSGTDIPAHRFGEGPRTNHPAPGNPIDPDLPNTLYPNDLYIRLRNRGTGEGKARVQLFASPAATLITPERWLPIGSGPVDVQGIPQGDTLTVSRSVPVDLPQKWFQDPLNWPKNVLPTTDVVPAYSFLAVQLPWKGSSYATPGYEQTTALPPGPPYFNWAAYRSFLRGPGVAWRNVHPIRVKPSTTDMTLPFLFAGTPDLLRHFEFEVIQRLPADVEVTLEVPGALAAKLRKGQPWLANGPGNLKLPRRPRTTLRQVALAPGVCAHAAFQISIGLNSLLRGHSLAIRQLWRGEEVGRITWWFIDE
jgi:serine protease